MKKVNKILVACDLSKAGASLAELHRIFMVNLSLPEKKRMKAIAPPVEVDSTAGAGDSVVGGFVPAHFRGKDLADCARLACAAGTATAQTPGTELCHHAGVEAILPRVELSCL